MRRSRVSSAPGCAFVLFYLHPPKFLLFLASNMQQSPRVISGSPQHVHVWVAHVAGKTTLLRLIAGLEDATAGKVFFEGAPHPCQLAQPHLST